MLPEQELLFLPAARSAITPTRGSVASAGVTKCTDEGWEKILALLSLDEIARLASALCANRGLTAEIGACWQPSFNQLPSQWPKGSGGLRGFLAAARSTTLAELVFCAVPRTLGDDVVAEPKLSAASSRRPRSVVVAAAPCALALSHERNEWEGYLAAASGKEVKLYRRDDLKGCGAIALQGCKEGVGTMCFSPDSGTLAVVPRSESGALVPSVQLYATEDKAKPVVTKFKSPSLAGIDFLHAGPSRTGASEDLVAACGMELFQVSASTGEIVKSWQRKEGSPFSACSAVSPFEVMTLAGRTVELWDVRTAAGVAKSAEVAEVVTALDAGSFGSSSLIYLGDARGALHRLDWRTGAAELLWSPAETRAPRARPSHKVMVDRGCACLLAGSTLTMLALDPCIVELGWADVSEQLSAMAFGSSAWAFAVQSTAASAKTAQPAVVVVETSGKVHRPKVSEEDLEAAAKKAEQKEKNTKKKQEKTETKGKKPSSGKSAHGRNSGR